jgi:HD-like signal output (HDOD) protein
MHTAQQAKNQILKLQHLPPLSATATRLLGLLSEEDLALSKLAEVINQDPGLAARILGLANSAYFGQQNPVLKVEDAIIRVLGLNMVKSLSFSIAVSAPFDVSGCHHFDLRRYWHDALAIAMLGRQIAVKSPIDDSPDPDGIYLAGLLKHIGVLVLVHVFPEAYNKVIQVSQQRGVETDVLALESETIGINHCEAGAWLADRWHLPSMIVAVISQSRVLSDIEQPKEATLVGAVSCWLKERFEDEQLADQCTSTLIECCGVSSEALNNIQRSFIDKEDEINAIANLLSS